jgi:hypothetical protein
MVLCLKKSYAKKIKKNDFKFEFFDPDYPSVNPYKKILFLQKKWSFTLKNSTDNFFWKTDFRSEFPDPDYPSVDHFLMTIVKFSLSYKMLQSDWIMQTNFKHF